MARRAAAWLIGWSALLLVTAVPAGAQEAPVVVVDAPVAAENRSEGVLREAEASSQGATVAVGAGVLVVGCTLVAITRRRVVIAPAASVPAAVVGGRPLSRPQWDPVLIERRAAGFLQEPIQNT